MNDIPTRLEAECAVFTSYLAGQTANEYVIDNYVEAHRVSQGLRERTRFESWLGALARTNRWLTRIADAYARIFAPHSVLRHKLVLLLAILETSPPFYRSLENVKRRGTLGHLIALTGHGIAALINLLLGSLVLLPAHLILGALDKRSSR